MNQIKPFPTIIYFQGEGNYTRIHFEDGSMKMSSYTLKKAVIMFSCNDQFLRIHKAYIVNKKFVENIIENTEGFYFKLTNGVILPVSRRKRDFIF